MDLRDGAKLRKLAAQYRAQGFKDVDKLGEEATSWSPTASNIRERLRAPPPRRSSTASAARPCGATSTATASSSGQTGVDGPSP